MMDLDELQSVRDRERQTDKLQQLRPTFYADAGELIQQLREQRSRAAERADDPFDAPEVSRLSDEIDTAEQTVEAIYEKRVGKIVKAASFAAADLPAESDGMTEEETKLFETLVDDIKQNRQHVLDVLAGETDEETNDPTPDASQSAPEPTDATADRAPPAEETESSDPEPPSPAEGALADGPPTGIESDDGPTEVSAADVMGSSADSEPRDQEPADPEPPAPTPGAGEADAAADADPARETDPEVRKDGGTATETTSGVDRETVRITADVGDIFGVDEREYDLAEDDVVTLPAANADPLVERDAAERL
jgi:DNA replication factor GINS